MIEQESRQANLRTMIALAKLQADFYADRPIMAVHNGDFVQLVGLLRNEIAELNGHAEDKMSLEKYREQEIADIVIFALGLCTQFGQWPTDKYLNSVCRAYDVEINQQLWATPQPFNEDDETWYLHIKQAIAEQAEALQGQESKQILLMAPAEQHRALQRLHSIVGLCWVLLSMLKVNPYDAIREKTARNHAKHSAYFYNKDLGRRREVQIEGYFKDDSDFDESFQDGPVFSTYFEAKKVAGAVWGDRKGNVEFYADANAVQEQPQEIR